MIHVYLDDCRPCPQGFTAARNAEECNLLIGECDIDVLSLDYDLGWGQSNGMQVVRHIIDTGRYPRKIYIHTSSDSGRANMYQALYTHKPDSVELVNGPIPYEALRRIAQHAEE